MAKRVRLLRRGGGASATLNAANWALFTGQFGLGLMHVLFNFYYVKVYLNVFRIEERWFNVAQTLYMVWNAVNDPLCGYLQDVSGGWMRRREKIFTYVGPFMALSFVIMWLPWGEVGRSPGYVEGLHLIASLFLYDAFYSCIGVAWSALFAEFTREHRKRVRGLKYSQLGILCSLVVITAAEIASTSLDNFPAFQLICCLVAVASSVCFYVTGRLGAVSSTMRHKSSTPLLHTDDPLQTATWGGVWALTRELVAERNFLRVVLTNFLHTCRAVAHLNFASIAVDLLVPQSVLAKGSWYMGGFFALCTLLPQLIVIFNERLLVGLGGHKVMMASFVISLVTPIALYSLSSSSPHVVLLFMLVDSVLVHATGPLFNIFLAEYLDDDLARNRRPSAVSSLVFSLNALIVKPSNSLTPMLIVYALNRSGYELYQTTNERSQELKLCMRRLIFAAPALLASLEYVAFRGYSLGRRRSGTMVTPVPPI